MQKKTSIARPILGALYEKGSLSVREIASHLQESPSNDARRLEKLVRMTLFNLAQYGWIKEDEKRVQPDELPGGDGAREEKRFRMTRRHLPAAKTRLFTQRRLDRERERALEAEFSGNGPTGLPAGFFTGTQREEQ